MSANVSEFPTYISKACRPRELRVKDNYNIQNVLYIFRLKTYGTNVSGRQNQNTALSVTLMRIVLLNGISLFS